MDKSDFFPRYAFCRQLLPDIIVNIKGTVIFGCGQITENKLCRAFLRCFLLDVKDIFHTQVYLALRAVRQHIVDQPLV